MLKDWQASRQPAPAPSATVPVPEPPSAEPSPIDDDMPQLHRLKDKFAFASKRTGVPEEILAGIASRESHAGKSLNKAGMDPDKQAFGIMQVDQRFHHLTGTTDMYGRVTPASQRHIDQAAEIVHQNKLLMDKRFPNWTEEQRWRAAVAGYNMGPGNVKTIDRMDEGTTGGDYSQDVMNRAKKYRLIKER